MSLTIDAKGHVINSKVTVRIFPHIERDKLTKVNGIIVHQTDAATAQSTFHSYMLANSNGAHFLIDKDGTIYQTAPIYKRTNHVGKIKARCVLENSCSPTDIEALKTYNPTAENSREQQKAYHDRFPTNSDSIGIELVGRSFADPKDLKNSSKNTFEAVTIKQNESLKWLITELSLTLCIFLTEVFRHPDVARKNKTEAATAVWE